MALDPTDVIRRFEPILFFHKNESFFPSDAKRYMEHCALWDVIGLPRDSKVRWGGTSAATFPHKPRIRRGKLVVGPNELPLDPESDDGVAGTFIGDPQKAPAILLDNDQAERFLDPAGWVPGADPAGAIGNAVNAATDTRWANTRLLAEFYEFRRPALIESQFWYHAEVFSHSRLARLLRGRGDMNLQRFSKLKDPVLVCYYLFFPGHHQPLEGCNSISGKLWASCAGAWSCIAVLLEGDGNQNNYKPITIGLTAGNDGLLEFLGEERRIGMQVFDWQLMSKVIHPRPNAGAGEHPLIFVAFGTHGLYRDQNARPLPLFSPMDGSESSCGEYETLAAANAAQAEKNEEREERLSIQLGKLIAAAGVGAITGSAIGPHGILGGAVNGAMLGTMAALAEIPVGHSLPSRPTSQIDHPPGPDEIGIVIHPAGVDPPGAPASGMKVWPRLNPNDPNDERKLDTIIDGRLYSLWVGTEAEPEGRPIWLPSEDPHKPSFRGRWGNRVENDRFNRRCGMRFPEFWLMFIEALGK